VRATWSQATAESSPPTRPFGREVALDLSGELVQAGGRTLFHRSRLNSGWSTPGGGQIRLRHCWIAFAGRRLSTAPRERRGRNVAYTKD